jgi:small subunit ribosomal protein S6
MTYEGMFLVDAGRDFGNASEPIKTVLERAEAEVLSMKPWEERRLAYEINGRKRALYVLTYFSANPANMAELERDVQLNEDILRMQVLRREDITDDELAAETPATEAHQQRERAAEAKAEQEQAAQAEASEEASEEEPAKAEESAEGEKKEQAPAESSEESEGGEDASEEKTTESAE